MIQVLTIVVSTFVVLVGRLGFALTQEMEADVDITKVQKLKIEVNLCLILKHLLVGLLVIASQY